MTPPRSSIRGHRNYNRHLGRPGIHRVVWHEGSCAETEKVMGKAGNGESSSFSGKVDHLVPKTAKTEDLCPRTRAATAQWPAPLAAGIPSHLPLSPSHLNVGVASALALAHRDRVPKACRNQHGGRTHSRWWYTAQGGSSRNSAPEHTQATSRDLPSSLPPPPHTQTHLAHAHTQPEPHTAHARTRTHTTHRGMTKIAHS
jgi:hypothetical protein